MCLPELVLGYPGRIGLNDFLPKVLSNPKIELIAQYGRAQANAQRNIRRHETQAAKGTNDEEKGVTRSNGKEYDASLNEYDQEDKKKVI